MDVSVIIVAYNSATTLAPCLASVRTQSGVAFEVILVDNASTDGTLAIARSLQTGARVIENPENIGFGRANNQGFLASCGRFLYLLNPDAETAHPDVLSRLCQAMEGHPCWGLAGTRIVGADGTSEAEPATAYPGQRYVSRDFSGLPGRIAWILGASMLVRREVYAALGGFDPGFFLYSEETDFCLRLREAGHEIGFVDEVTVRHIGGGSEMGRDPYEVTRRKMAGLHRFWQKHYSAEDAARLVRRDLHRARFRMLWYGFSKYFQSAAAPSRKYLEYRAIWEASKGFLAAKTAGSPR